MINDFEKIMRIIYRKWKATGHYIGKEHPNEETLACFLEGKLALVDRDQIQKHLLSCDLCIEYLTAQLKIEAHLSKDVPVQLLEKVKKMINADVRENLLDIFLHLKEKFLEIIQTNGDVLVGQELIPAPVLRSRQINEFKEEVSILKDLQQIRVLAKIEHKNARSFNLIITVKDKQSRICKDLRVTLIKDSVELESYISDCESCIFENILPGNYMVEFTKGTEMVAVIDLKVKT